MEDKINDKLEKARSLIAGTNEEIMLLEAEVRRRISNMRKELELCFDYINETQDELNKNVEDSKNE